jgi:hypothetical protein
MPLLGKLGRVGAAAETPRYIIVTNCQCCCCWPPSLPHRLAIRPILETKDEGGSLYNNRKVKVKEEGGRKRFRLLSPD